jgi:nitrite reductase/ring-hydroxylating ferredoxin subunit
MRSRIGAPTTTARSAKATGSRTPASSSALGTGRPLTLPAFLPVDTFPVTVEDGIVKVDVR